MATNYKNLEDRLTQGGDRQTYSFHELEEIIGGPISPVYINRKAFKFEKSCFRKSAEQAGFIVSDVDYTGQTITFEKQSANANSQNNTRIVNGAVAPFAGRQITDSEALQLLLYVCKQWDAYLTSLGSLGDGGGIKDYLKDTDRMLLDPLFTLSPSQYLYKQLAMHAQNSRLSRQIKFLDGNEPLIKELTGEYGLHPARDVFALPTLSDTMAALSSELARQTPSIPLNEDWKSYAKAMRSISAYVYPTGSPSKSAADIYSACYVAPTAAHSEINGIFNNFISIIPNGFKEALTFDFLKSCDSRFDYPKPDLHIRRVMYYLGHACPIVTDKLDGNLPPFEAMSLFMDWVEAAKREYVRLGGSNPSLITVYKIDRMIYQLCADEPLFLFPDKINNPGHKVTRANKKRFVVAVALRRYRSTIASTDIAYLDALLS